MTNQNNQIAEIEEALINNRMFEKFNLSRVGVFGSAARGEQSNDIDILIEDNIDYRLLSAFRNELQESMNKSIDVVIAKYANPIVLRRALKEIVYVTRH